MKLFQTSGPALFMYTVIACTLIAAVVCFYVYYGSIFVSEIVLWIGITSFTILYHFWGRIILGNVSKIFRKFINYKSWWFRERDFEKGLYEKLKVKKWKKNALTYNPEQFDLKENSIEKILQTTAKSEVDHWINELVSISTMFFGLLWGQTWIFVITALAAMIFDAQFIVIQRYNRPRLLKVLEMEREKEAKKVEEKDPSDLRVKVNKVDDIINKKK
ncbi:MAG: hypothetical protein IKJ36_07015 [Clostridia bacterium]|nr:hypothetical protein [Clostridia bacterium]